VTKTRQKDEAQHYLRECSTYQQFR